MQFHRPDLYQIITLALVLAVLAALGFFIFNLTKGKLGKAALSIDAVYEKAMVKVNGKEKGETPAYLEDVFAGNINVEINGKASSYSTTMKPASGTLAVVNRDLGINEDFSSGQNIWFDKTGGEDAFISVISPKVDEVSVVVDGVEIGKTPVRFSTKDLLSQNDEGNYTLSFQKDTYESQEVDVKVKSGYTLTIRTDLFLKPIPAGAAFLQGLPAGVDFVNLSNVSHAAFADKQSWAKAINYWMTTRGAVSFDEVKVEKFDFFVSSEGKIYNFEGNEVAPLDMKLESGMKVAYLGLQQEKDLSEKALAVISEALGGAPVVVGETGQMVKLLTTGWAPDGYDALKVRSGAGAENPEIARVATGKNYKLLEEKSGWYRIEYESGKDGWVSGSYVEKVKEE